MVENIGFELIEAEYISEGNSRFICTIYLYGKPVECYVPISCKLSRLLPLTGTNILVTKNSSKSQRTEYSLFAVQNQDLSYTIISTSFANRIVKAYLSNIENNQSFLIEKTIKNYKCDFYLPSSNTVIEVKSIITLDEYISLPNLNSERAVNQLQVIKRLLKSGIGAKYIFIAFAPHLREITIDVSKIYGKLIKQCCDLNMQLICFRITLYEDKTIKYDSLKYNFSK